MYETSFTLIYSCIIIPLYETLHDRPFSVTSEESLRDLTFSYWVPEHQGTGYFMRSECIKLVLVNLTHCQLHVALVLSILHLCLRGVHVLHEALVYCCLWIPHSSSKSECSNVVHLVSPMWCTVTLSGSNVVHLVGPMWCTVTLSGSNVVHLVGPMWCT